MAGSNKTSGLPLFFGGGGVFTNRECMWQGQIRQVDYPFFGGGGVFTNQECMWQGQSSPAD